MNFLSRLKKKLFQLFALNLFSLKVLISPISTSTARKRNSSDIKMEQLNQNKLSTAQNGSNFLLQKDIEACKIILPTESFMCVIY